MSKKYNPSDADDTPPPAYQEVVDPPFNPNFPSSSQQQQQSAPQPPHTPDINRHYQQQQQLYPQIPTMPSPPISFPQPQHYQQQQQQIQPHGNNQQQVRYQAIEIPQNNLLRERRRRHTMESRKFPLAAIFFLFGWFCPPLWIIGACCCAGSRNAYESFWGKVNFLMAMILIITSLIYSGFAVSQYYM